MWLRKKFRKVCPFHEILYANDLIFMSESIERIQRKFANWKYALESKGVKVNN